MEKNAPPFSGQSNLFVGHPQDECNKKISAFRASYWSHIPEDWNLPNNTFKGSVYEIKSVMQEMFIQIIVEMDIVIGVNKPCSQQIWISWCEKYWFNFSA